MQDRSEAKGGCGLRRVEVQRQMRPLSVVVLDVLAKNRAQVAFAEDEQTVQALMSNGFDHALAMGVGVRFKNHVG